jgi:hypothetical protein
MRRRTFVSSLLVGGPLAAALGQTGNSAIRAATFQADVTPPVGSVLCHGGVAPAKEIVSPLTARGVILMGPSQPVVLCAVDWVGIGNRAHDAWRAELAKAVHTSPDRVSVHVVHQHDAPGIDYSTEEILATCGLSGAMFDKDFADEALQRVASAAHTAIAQGVPVTHVGFGKGRVDKVASNRRILDSDGHCALTRMSSCRNPRAIAAPEGIIDPDVRLVTFFHDDRPLVCLTYYACHPQSFYGRGGVNWDFPGYARAARSKAIPEALHIHFNGAGGDIAAGKYNDGSPANRPVLARRLELGMKAAWDGQRKVPLAAQDFSWRVRSVQLPVRDSIREDDCLARLRDLTLKRRTRLFAARDLAWLRRMNSTYQIELSCLRLGPVRILHMPGELCIGYQLAAQAMRPHDFVCLAAYGDLGPGYICLEIAYRQGGYETSFVSRVAPTVENTLMQAMQDLLEV